MVSRINDKITPDVSANLFVHILPVNLITSDIRSVGSYKLRFHVSINKKTTRNLTVHTYPFSVTCGLHSSIESKQIRLRGKLHCLSSQHDNTCHSLITFMDWTKNLVQSIGLYYRPPPNTSGTF